MKFTAEAITADWGEKCGEFEPECPTCVTWAFFDEIARLRSELANANRHIEALQEKDASECACSYDRPDDVCLFHTRMKEDARNAALEEAAKLIEEGFDRPGIGKKQDTCAHGKFGWEDCEQCAVVAIRALKAEGESQ